MNKLIALAFIVLTIGCAKQNEFLKISYVKGGQTFTDKIDINKFIIDDENIQTDYIKQMSFELIDSVNFIDNNPDKISFCSTPVELDFTKPVNEYTPEYYSIATAYYTNKCVRYYNLVFDNKIMFQKYNKYRAIKVLQGNYALFSRPNQYILEEKQLFSPSIFYHEIGHVAFWLLEGDLGIKFKGLSPLHVGLMEYFTVSLYDYPLVGELVLKKAIRDASVIYTYPQPDSMRLRRTFALIKESFPLEMLDTNTVVAQYYNLSLQKYDKILDKAVDNHRGGFLYTSTLWRIREQLGQEKTDKLVAQTILNLN